MDAGVPGLGAVAWNDAWKAAAPDALLRLSIDPARLLEILEDLPVSRALLADLRKAVSTGRSVEVAVTPDHAVAELRAGAAHHLLTAAVRDAVLKALGATLPIGPGRAATAPPAAAQQGIDTIERDARPAAGVLWHAPSAPAAAQGCEAPALAGMALQWLGATAQLSVERDGAGAQQQDEDEARRVFRATLKLELAKIGPLEASIRVCGNAVAVQVGGRAAAGLGPRLDDLARALRRQGLDCAHVGLAAVQPPEGH